MRKLLRGAGAVWVALLTVSAPAWAELPYQRHGWTSEQAAAHLLSRFTYGAEPGQVKAVAKAGLEEWLTQQLKGTETASALASKLAALPPAYRMSNAEIVAHFPPPGKLRKMAGVEGEPNSPDSRAKLAEYRKQQGLGTPKELGVVLFAQRLYHARYAQSQVQEVMTDFWFNHFNVSTTNNRARPFILSYERDAIRPNALGSFRTLLGKTAKHPAMLWYLDNATSTAGAEATTTMEPKNPKAQQRLQKRKKGLNENYARELLELHTLGVDGGYTQSDVTQAARVLTGWTAVPYENAKAAAARRGFQREGDFVFAAPLHDAGAKTVLGQNFPAGGGQEEGERLLDLVATHPSTAKHIARKLAVRFLSDQPSPQTVDSLAATFQQSQGDSKALILAIARTDEFWQEGQRASKIKSPLELVVSAARILEADLEPTAQLFEQLADMGQPLFGYQAPTGFPDRADAWISSGTVLARMNFGLTAARGDLLGFSYTVPKTGGLEDVITRLLPTLDPAPVKEKLEPVLANLDTMTFEKPKRPAGRGNLGGKLPGRQVSLRKLPLERRDDATLIGLVLGSPDFQRK